MKVLSYSIQKSVTGIYKVTLHNITLLEKLPFDDLWHTCMHDEKMALKGGPV